MSDSQAGPSIGGIFTGTLAFVLAILCFIGYAASFLVVDYIEDEIVVSANGYISRDLFNLKDKGSNG